MDDLAREQETGERPSFTESIESVDQLIGRKETYPWYEIEWSRFLRKYHGDPFVPSRKSTKRTDGGFKRIIEDYTCAALAIEKEENIERVLGMLGDERSRKEAWFILCRRLSTFPSEARQLTFEMISNYLSHLMAKEAPEGEGFDRKAEEIMLAGKMLSHFSKKYGLEAFLLGLAKSQFGSLKEREQTKRLLVGYVFPRLCTATQFLRAARWVSTKLDDPDRQSFYSFFQEKFSPQGEFTFLEEDIYARIKPEALEAYPRGEAMLEEDLAALERAGVRKAKRIVDFASGTGRHVEVLKKRGIKGEITAMDLGLKYLLELKDKKAVEAMVNANWFNLPFKEGSFDFGILLGRDLPHMVNSHERRRFFREAARVLTEKGKLVLDVPDITMGEYKDMVIGSRRIFARWREETERTYSVIDTFDNLLFTFRYFASIDQLIDDIQASGFKVVDICFRKIPDSEARNVYFILEKTEEPAQAS